MSCCRFSLFSLFFVALLLGLPGWSPAQEREQWLEGVRPTYRYEKSKIAIPQFNASNTSLESDTLPRIIRNDLLLSGLFELPKDQLKVNRQNIIDHRQGRINFEFWGQEGVEHYLMGGVEEANGQYKVRVVLYDIPSRRMILSREFSESKARVRTLAHQISDTLILQLKGVEGVGRTKLLFTTESIPGVREISIMDWDGFNRRSLTQYGKIATSPDWGANGTEIYYTSYHGNRAVIYGMQLTIDDALNYRAGQTWPIAAYGGTNSSPAWNSRAKRLVAVLSKDGNSEIYTMNRSGKDLRRLTRTRYTEGSPAWSPDGSKIAYTSNEAGGVHLFVMKADGSGKRRVTTTGSWNDEVSWSPDGGRLAYVKRGGGRNDIYVCDASGEQGSMRRLTMNQGNNEAPTWAPNGTHIAFQSDRTGSWQIYLMLDDGSNQRQITSNGENRKVDWGPVPPTLR